MRLDLASMNVCIYLILMCQLIKMNSVNRLVPVILQNGDYGFFIHQEFQWGLLVDPRRQTIAIFGSPLVRAIERNAPVLFQK